MWPGWVRNRRLARAINDQGWAAFHRQLVYKCDWYGVEAAASAAILPVVQAVLGLRAGQGQLAAGRADVHLPGVRAGHRPGSQRGQESGPACPSWCMGRREFLGDLGKRLSSGQSWPDRQRPGETACGKAGTDSHPRRHAHRCVDSDERFNSLQVGRTAAGAEGGDRHLRQRRPLYRRRATTPAGP
jgi:hypothetical protein